MLKTSTQKVPKVFPSLGPQKSVDPLYLRLDSINRYAVILVKTAGAKDGKTLYPNDKLAGAFMQYFVSLNPWQWTGDKYLYKNEYNNGLFETTYSID